jgi:ATP-dependent RNA helicase DOB1
MEWRAACPSFSAYAHRILQLAVAAKAIGNDELEGKFKEGIKLMRRDIIFAASLYL